MTARRAPYLSGVPSLPDDLLAGIAAKRPSPAVVARARRTIERLRRLIRQARSRHELQLGRAITPQPPAAGD